MRRMWAAGAAVLSCLTLGGSPVTAQGDTPTWYGAETVTATQACPSVQVSGANTCDHTASDPRVTGTLTFRFRGAAEQDVDDAPISVYWTDVTLEGPAGSWTGHGYLVGIPERGVQGLSILVGEGAYAGWTYISSGMDPEANANTESIGVIYQGPPPPFEPLPSPASD